MNTLGAMIRVPPFSALARRLGLSPAVAEAALGLSLTAMSEVDARRFIERQFEWSRGSMQYLRGRGAHGFQDSFPLRETVDLLMGATDTFEAAVMALFFRQEELYRRSALWPREAVVWGLQGIRSEFAALRRAVEVSRESYLDALTGIPNRQALLQRFRALENLLESNRVEDRGPHFVAMLDIDFFKKVNDTFGHAAGDTVLREVAKRVAAAIRDTDAVFRYGGEEFLLFIRNVPYPQAEMVFDKIRQVVSRTPIVIDQSNRITVTVSIGVAELKLIPDPRHASAQTSTGAFRSAMGRADENLYRSKREGRNRVSGIS